MTDALAWIDGGEWVRVLLLRDYNTRVVVLGATLLGTAAGVVGSFAYLRKRAMLGDALSHATLPGIALAFLLTGEKQIGWLLLGAATTGVLGVLAVMGLRYVPRVREDAAIGIVLSVFFGAGMVLLSIIQQLGTGNEAGLQRFIYGQTASMLKRDALLIMGTAGLVLTVCAMLYKEFRLVCFDKAYAAALGRPVFLIDLVMMGLVTLTVVVGLQAVGLILVVALLIVPGAGARFWTDRMLGMVLLAGAFGAVSGWLGATISALTPRLPAGAVIVMVTGVWFLISLFLAPRRGVLAGMWRQWALARRVAEHHLLRALAEFEEQRGEGTEVTIGELLPLRSWSRGSLQRLIRRAKRRGWLEAEALPRIRLTPAGRREACRVLRNHRLWELYLIHHADIAPSHVDRDADEIEHVLPEEIVSELERILAQQQRIPPSPHQPEPIA